MNNKAVAEAVRDRCAEKCDEHAVITRELGNMEARIAHEISAAAIRALPLDDLIQPVAAVPSVQCGWADEFGNLFPLAAWKPAKRTYEDDHKSVWRPVYTAPQPSGDVVAGLVALLVESQSGISTSWNERRDAALAKVQEQQ